MPYQRGQLWIRRFQRQAESICAALATLTPPMAALNFVSRALQMLQAIGWIHDRFAGKPAPNNCSSIAVGNPLDPLPQP